MTKPPIRGFIRLPPDECDEHEAANLSLLCTAVDFVDLLGPLTIEAHVDKFKETKNPVLALEAFVASIDNGVFPPLEVLRWLADGFRAYHDAQGRVELGKLLGLAGSRGQTPAYKQLLLDERNKMLLLDMDMLIYLGAYRSEAGEMVARRLDDSDWNKSDWEMKDLSADALVDMHARAAREPLDHETAKLLGLLDKERVERYLSKFPPDSISQRFRNMV